MYSTHSHSLLVNVCGCAPGPYVLRDRYFKGNSRLPREAVWVKTRPEFADCYSISFEEPHGSAAVSFLQHLYTLMNTLSPQSKWAVDRCTLYELKQAEFHFKASAQLGFLVASWHALDFTMYLPSSEDNMRLFLFFPPPCTTISSQKILPGGFLER